MADLSLPALLLLHGENGGWDELAMLVAGVALAIFVVKWTQRSAGDQAAEEVDPEQPAETESQQTEPR
jgi:hypothetical protein